MAAISFHRINAKLPQKPDQFFEMQKFAEGNTVKLSDLE